ncbi:PLDc N-terminal domain-containing protein [Mucisphaera calidilacus]|uniref:Cardiolipin synthase N-terminal domain-containing protein n=1 Tax=Mucisphaera calidilacus TaxID=2527982 RepID=A0A518BTX8_9BACT|nr:PLDc N-terminal domain-containing protein [Mucisphaera calidilacus]QDU70430.1 hypothetical protein Pan265_02570 [Mucisphaera calidilacus]
MLELILSLVVLAVAIYAIIDVVGQPMSTGKKTIWIILILLFPLLGAIIYFLVGRG